jgi:hypothetical protein
MLPQEAEQDVLLWRIGDVMNLSRVLWTYSCCSRQPPPPRPIMALHTLRTLTAHSISPVLQRGVGSQARGKCVVLTA